MRRAQRRRVRGGGMSEPNVNARRFVMHMGWFFGVVAVLLISNLLCTAPHLFSPVWYAVMWAALANVVRRMLLAFVAPCPWEMERIIRRKFGYALNEVRTVTALAHYFRDMSARAGVRYDLVETGDGLTAMARFSGEK